MTVQFHCVIQSEGKKAFPIVSLDKTQYSFRISGKRGYDSNRLYETVSTKFKWLQKFNKD